MKRVLSILFLICIMVSSLTIGFVYADDENYESATYKVVTDIKAEIVDGETGESAGGLQVILNYGDEYQVIDQDGNSQEYERSATVATFAKQTEKVNPEDLTEEQIEEIENSTSDIEEAGIPVIVVTGYDTMLYANDLVDYISPDLNVSEKADKDTITGLHYQSGVLVELAYQLSEKNDTAKKLITSFDKEKELLNDVKDTISSNTEKLQARLEERITLLTEKLEDLDKNSSEYKEISSDIEAARDKLKETKTDAYEDLSNYTPLTILDISMNSIAKEMMGEQGYIRLYISIDGIDYDDEVIIVNTHVSDEEKAIKTVEEAEKAGKKVSDSDIEEIFDQCKVADSYIVPAAVKPDGSVREIGFNEMYDVVLEEDEVLEPKVNLMVTKTSPFLVLSRNPETSFCIWCNERSPLFLGLCWHFWLVLLIIIIVIIIIILLIILRRRDKDKKKKDEEKEIEEDKKSDKDKETNKETKSTEQKKQ